MLFPVLAFNTHRAVSVFDRIIDRRMATKYEPGNGNVRIHAVFTYDIGKFVKLTISHSDNKMTINNASRSV